MIVKNKGFTLIEVLASLFIVSTIAVFSTGIIRNAYTSIDAVDENKAASLCVSNITKRILLGDIDKNKGDSYYGSFHCQWFISAEQTDIDNFFRYTVTAFNGDTKEDRLITETSVFRNKLIEKGRLALQ